MQGANTIVSKAAAGRRCNMHGGNCYLVHGTFPFCLLTLFFSTLLPRSTASSTKWATVDL